MVYDYVCSLTESVIAGLFPLLLIRQRDDVYSPQVFFDSSECLIVYCFRNEIAMGI